MFDIFGIKRRREEKRKAQEEKLRAIKTSREFSIQRRKELVDKFLKEEREKDLLYGKQLHEEDIKECNEKNSICPRCGGGEVINKFVRIKGDLSGSSGGYVSGSGGLLGGYISGHSSGHIEGHLDTQKVNECSKCGHQWEISIPKHNYDCDYAYDSFDVYGFGSPVGFLYRRISRIINDKEKLEKSHYLTGTYESAPREVLEYCIFKWAENERYREDITDIFGIPIIRDEESPEYNNDPYLFRFNDRVWEIVKTVIGREE